MITSLLLAVRVRELVLVVHVSMGTCCDITEVVFYVM